MMHCNPTYQCPDVSYSAIFCDEWVENGRLDYYSHYSGYVSYTPGSRLYLHTAHLELHNAN